MLGIHLLENKKKLLGFGVRILGFLVPKSFVFPKKIFVTYYQISIPCFLTDIDPRTTIFKILLNGSFVFFGARLLPISPHFELPSFLNL